jgi:antitoxin ParD1/3/4
MQKETSGTTMNISLPETLKDYVKERVAEGIYSNPSDYIRALIRSEMKRNSQHQFEAMILEGINSGPATEMTHEDWQGIKAEAKRRTGNKPHQEV